MAAIAPIFGGLLGAGGAAGGGFGLFGSILSAFGSLIGGGSTADVPTPAPVIMQAAQPLPDIKDPVPAATLLSEQDKQQMQLDEKRRKLIATQTKSDTKNNITQGNSDPAILDKVAILGGN